jgi:hypothetical protein
MALPSSAQRKRPPPIELPLELPSTFSLPHQVPAHKPFAAATGGEGREQQNQLRGAAHLEQRPHTRDGSETPLLRSFEHEDNAKHLPRSNSVSRFRESASTTFTNIMDHARGGFSPKKTQSQQTSSHSHGTGQASSDGRNNSKSRSRHSERVYRPDLSAVGEQHRTLRGEIEKQHERKYFKMMGAVPDTPTDGQ